MPTDKQSIISVVLSGGAGTRLWPASREGHPKPFMKLADGQTLIEKTYARAKALGSEVLTVTNRDYYFMSRDEQERVGASGSFLLEPFGRNTAPAIALAAKMIEATEGADAVMLVLAADHLIADQAGFASAVAEASRLSVQDYLVTFGIVPTAPETGFGYIERGESLESGNKVARFVEKPDLETAQGYLSSGKYLRNSGMFCFKAGVFLAELAKHAPKVAEAVDACWAAMQPLNNAQMAEIPAELFKSAPDISIDYAVMEKAANLSVVPFDGGWSDLGGWDAVWRESPKGENGVLTSGEATAIDCEDTLLRSDSERLEVLGIGLKNIMAVAMNDAVLVADMSRAQDVKKAVDALKAKNAAQATTFPKDHRPWGWFESLVIGDRFQVKRIHVHPGAALSLQSHHHRAEHWIVVSGTAEVEIDGKVQLVSEDQSVFIPLGAKHRMKNPGKMPMVLIEVQTGSYLGEDDIIRYEDVYSRGQGAKG